MLIEPINCRKKYSNLNREKVNFYPSGTPANKAGRTSQKKELKSPTTEISVFAWPKFQRFFFVNTLLHNLITF